MKLARTTLLSSAVSHASRLPTMLDKVQTAALLGLDARRLGPLRSSVKGKTQRAAEKMTMMTASCGTRVIPRTMTMIRRPKRAQRAILISSARPRRKKNLLQAPSFRSPFSKRDPKPMSDLILNLTTLRAKVPAPSRTETIVTDVLIATMSTVIETALGDVVIATEGLASVTVAVAKGIAGTTMTRTVATVIIIAGLITAMTATSEKRHGARQSSQAASAARQSVFSVSWLKPRPPSKEFRDCRPAIAITSVHQFHR